jgi:2,4-dienoyl-CoA reductase-like NADH-dependent reductase (Old Yellow Enzyme family)
VAQFKSVAAFQARLSELGLPLPLDPAILTAAAGSPLGQPLPFGPLRCGNRWCIHPMEGWDAQPDGTPSELTLRRWQNFGASGAKLIWGGEAAAVVPAGRANPRQLLATPGHEASLARLLDALRAAHRERYGACDDLLVGLQLTHSGRYSRPDSGGPRPRVAVFHPLLDDRLGLGPLGPESVCSDDELERLLDALVAAAAAARAAGFQFVDLKACHGYLLHELLGARRRPGRFGGDFAGRTRLLTSAVERVRGTFPDLLVGVRLSVFDSVPYRPGRDVGAPLPHAQLIPYEWGFGVDPLDPTRIDLTEPLALLRRLAGLGVAAVNLTCGSPYYSPHLQRPALFPPSDGYLPPEDPLCGVWRQIDAARACRAAVPGLTLIGSGYSYLQEYLPHVAQAVVRQGWIDAVGLGRMVLAYPELPHDVLARGQLDRRRLCRTLSDCTTAPRSGLVSGCYPLDPFYKALPQAHDLRQAKQSPPDA